MFLVKNESIKWYLRNEALFLQLKAIVDRAAQRSTEKTFRIQTSNIFAYAVDTSRQGFTVVFICWQALAF